MDLRATNATVDTVLFVLLAGAAVGLLSGIEHPESGGAERLTDETADVLATSTTTVSYERTARVEGGILGMQERTVRAPRDVHGTYAELTGAAVVANAALDETPLTGSDGGLETGVRSETRRVLPTGERRGQVQAVWRPYPDAPLASDLTIGPEPPEDVDVAASTLTVSSGLSGDSEPGSRAANSRGFDGIASAVSDGVVRGLFPPDVTADAIDSDGPDRALVVERYRRASAALGVTTRNALADRDVETANDRLRTALRERIRQDLHRRYGSPAAAARDLRTDRVHIVVRTWSV